MKRELTVIIEAEEDDSPDKSDFNLTFAFRPGIMPGEKSHLLSVCDRIAQMFGANLDDINFTKPPKEESKLIH